MRNRCLSSSTALTRAAGLSGRGCERGLTREHGFSKAGDRRPTILLSFSPPTGFPVRHGLPTATLRQHDGVTGNNLSHLADFPEQDLRVVLAGVWHGNSFAAAPSWVVQHGNATPPVLSVTLRQQAERQRCPIGLTNEALSCS